jgi:hypothetical protein
MSLISTAYDNFHTRVAAVFTSGAGWSKLPHAYIIDRNPEIYLKQGYAVGLGTGTNTKRLQSNVTSISREFILTITREMPALDLEVSGRETFEKSLFEDLKLIVSDMETDSTLNQGQILCSYQGDGGIEYVDGDTSEFISIRAIFLIEYFETL